MGAEVVSLMAIPPTAPAPWTTPDTWTRALCVLLRRRWRALYILLLLNQLVELVEHVNIRDIVVASDPLAQVRKRYKGRRMVRLATLAWDSSSSSNLLQASKSDLFQGPVMPFLTWLSLPRGVVGALGGPVLAFTDKAPPGRRFPRRSALAAAFP